MSTLIKRKRRNRSGNNNARQHGICATSLDDAAAQAIHCYEAKTSLASVLLRLQTALRRYNAIVRRRSKPAGTNQAKTPESTKTLPERIEAKTAPSPPTPASKRHQKVKQFLPVFNETNQPGSCRFPPIRKNGGELVKNVRSTRVYHPRPDSISSPCLVSLSACPVFNLHTHYGQSAGLLILYG